MGDGSNIGVKPARALETILGGKEPPPADERLRKDQMLAEILAMPDDYEAASTDYNTTSMWLAKQFYLLRKDGVDGDLREMYEAMKKKCGEHDYDFTGFMVGWANNTARWLLELPEQGNPALVTIG